jgi:hypothetical protein
MLSCIYTLLYTHSCTVSYSHTLNLLTLSYRLLKSVIQFRLFCGTGLSFLIHPSTTPILQPNINLLFLKRIHPQLFVLIHSYTHPYLLTLTLTQIETHTHNLSLSLSLSHSYACTTISLLSITRSTSSPILLTHTQPL